MKRNYKSKIPVKNGSDSNISNVKSTNLRSDKLSGRNESNFRKETKAFEDDMAVQFKLPYKSRRITHMIKDPNIGTLPETSVKSRENKFFDHGKPYYNESLMFEGQNRYSGGYERVNDPFERAKEKEKRDHIEIYDRDELYFNEDSRSEDRNYYSGACDNVNVSFKRAEESDKRYARFYENGKPYYKEDSKSEDQKYYSDRHDNRVYISSKRSKEAEIVKRNNTEFSYHGRPYYNQGISIEDESYLSADYQNRVHTPHKSTKQDSEDRIQPQFVREKLRYNSSLNAGIPFGSEAASIPVLDRTQKALELPDSRYEINKESDTSFKQRIWTRKKGLSHGYHNSALSIEDEKNYMNDMPLYKHEEVLSFPNFQKDSSFENVDEHKKGKKLIHSRIHYTDHLPKSMSTEEKCYNESLKKKFQKTSKNENTVLPNQIFEDVLTGHSHKMGISDSSLQSGYSKEEYNSHNQPRSDTNIRNRHLAANDYSDGFQHIDCGNLNRNVNVEPELNVKPLTINDAYLVAEVIRGESKQTLPFTMDDQNSNAILDEYEKMDIVGRKCWSKMCFSVSWHSHAVTRSVQDKSVVNREAILDTLPLGRPKEKSCWTKCLSIFDCFKHASAALELWNDSLKRIEGLQGTGVVSYFVFLRWLIALNLILFILYFSLITFPHAAFNVLPLTNISVAPNETVLTEEFLNKYDNPKPSESKPKEIKNASLSSHSVDLFSNWGELLENLPDNILDLTLHYSKRNYTTAERRNYSEYCAAIYRKEIENNTVSILSAMQDLLQGTGWLQSTVLFLGHYPANEISYFGLAYNMPIAVIAVLFVSFVICLCMMIQYSSHGVQETILARKNDYLQYSNILFCSWDYCIEDRKSSVIRHNSILHEIKSTLAEERRKREIKQWSKGKKIKVYFLRTFINLFVIAVLCSSYYLIYRVVNYQLEKTQLHLLNEPGVNTLFIQYLSPIVITSLNIFVPIIFNNIVKLEMYNTQTQINMALFRTVFLRLSSVFVLVGLLYQQITCEPRDMCGAGMTETCLSPICWETYVGQQLYKLAVTDFFVYVILFIIYDIPRDIIVRHCKNKVTQLIGRQIFDLPNQVLSLVYSQTLCWLGIVYSPLLPAITVMKFVVIFYIKKQMVLKYCVPAPIPYKASRSNAMFMIILMLSFLALMIIHGYSLSSVEPSAACSPFRHYVAMTDALKDAVSKHSSTFASIFNFFFSALFLIPGIILLCIAIYYYWTIVVGHRKMVKALKAQIAIEGHDKQFLLNRLTEVAKGQFYK